MSINRNTYRNFVDYFADKLGRKKKHAFEKKIMQDLFESDAYDGLQKLNAIDFESDMQELQASLQSRTKKQRKIPVWLASAAGILLIIGVTSILFYLSQPTDISPLVSEQLQKEVPVATVPITDSIADTLKQPIDVPTLQSEKKTIQKQRAKKKTAAIKTEPKKKLQTPKTTQPSIGLLKLSTPKYNSFVDSSAKPKSKAKPKQTIVQFASYSQQQKAKNSNIRIVKGKILGEKKELLPGVSVMIKGTSQGAVTNMDGEFEIQLPNDNKDHQLIASYIGYKSKEMSATNDNMTVTLEADNIGLSEVVVVAFGKQRKEALTGSVQETKHTKQQKTNQTDSIAKWKKDFIKKILASNIEGLKGEYKVKLKFKLNTDGAISEVVFRNEIPESLQKEIVRLLYQEKWKPTIKNQQTVSSWVKVKLKFTLGND
ncbi:hypothetical protein EMN47_17150 [Prolixibacteraceae bacterium JC049]|nr:hypothetical protein [Prolixibacteraceae bacterium JC049]